MGDGKNQDEIVLLKVDDSVRETADYASSRVFVECLPGPWKLLDAINREKDLPGQLISKAGPFPVVGISGTPYLFRRIPALPDRILVDHGQGTREVNL